MLKIKIENHELEFPNNKEEVATVLNEIEKAINKTSKVLHSIIVDNKEVYDDYENYFLNNILSIEQVEVRLISYEQMITDILVTGADYLAQAPQLIEGLAENFYKNPSDQDWSTLADLLEGLGWVFGTYHAIKAEPELDEIVKKQTKWVRYSEEVSELETVVPEFEEAVVNKDTIMIADILSYEVKPRFAMMAAQLKSLVELED